MDRRVQEAQILLKLSGESEAGIIGKSGSRANNIIGESNDMKGAIGDISHAGSAAGLKRDFHPV